MAVINGDNNSNTLYATEASQINGYGGNDTIYGSNFNDIIHGGTGNDVAYGNSGNDVVIGNQGSDQLYGGNGDDLIVGDNTLSPIGAGNDVLNGGAGNDRLYGNYGDDLYQYAVNTGIDTINDGRTAAEVPGYGGGTDTIRFTNTTFDNIYYLALSNDLLLFTSEGVGQDGTIQHGVIIQDFYLNDENTNIEYLSDSSGAMFDLSQLLTPGETSYTDASLHSLALA